MGKSNKGITIKLNSLLLCEVAIKYQLTPILRYIAYKVNISYFQYVFKVLHFEIDKMKEFQLA
jgi:hypothetical protein